MSNPSAAEVKAQLKRMLIDVLRLEGKRPEEIGDSEQLFGKDSPLGLDSLSALELLTAVEYEFGVRFDNDGTAKRHFESIESLAAFVISAKG